MARVFLNIGSNIGDRRKNIFSAIDKIRAEFGECRLSEIVESEPWGFDSTLFFLNIAVEFESDKDPFVLLDILQAIEKSISNASHRKSDGTYADRIIDIDIMAIDNIVIDDARLKIPHPCLMQRSFFIDLLLQLAPEWQYPEC